jgi:hypothetical protein
MRALPNALRPAAASLPAEFAVNFSTLCDQAISDLLVLSDFEGIPILSPAAFWKLDAASGG